MATRWLHRPGSGVERRNATPPGNSYGRTANFAQTPGSFLGAHTPGVPEDDGFLSVTNQRVVFLGNRKTVELVIAKIVGMELYSDGIRFNVSNRQRAPLFTTGNVEVIAATINKVIGGDYTLLTRPDA